MCVCRCSYNRKLDVHIYTFFFNMIYWACSTTLVVLHAFSPLFTFISYNQIVKVY